MLLTIKKWKGNIGLRDTNFNNKKCITDDKIICSKPKAKTKRFVESVFILIYIFSLKHIPCLNTKIFVWLSIKSSRAFRFTDNSNCVLCKTHIVRNLDASALNLLPAICILHL